MHVFRQRAKVHGNKVDFASHFCQSSRMPYILMAYVNIDTKRIVESWVGRCPSHGEESVSELVKTVELRLALHFTISRSPGDGPETFAPDIMDGDCVWVDAGCHRICIGEFVGKLAPIIAFKKCADQDPEMQQAMVKMGMAYVQLQLNQMVTSQAEWQENILRCTTRALSISIVVVSRTGEIVHDGRGRKKSVGCVSGLNIENNRFVGAAADMSALHLAIMAATSEEKKTSTVSITGGKGGSQLLLVMPLVDSSSPLALIMFETEQLDHTKICETFCDTYDLTASERKIARSIIGGLTIAQAAEEAMLSVATARSYMKQIFAKTGTHRQSELISLYYESILPAATGIGTLGRVQP
ncbi:helix-turn-helix transcriptional regulator [Sulfitobacter sp.]|uniref:helix-turn-helix transcriptional regulator n=1 Tax=Sulfitobacter sp. TaxID=1903071 RepID=UPI0030033AD0